MPAWARTRTQLTPDCRTQDRESTAPRPAPPGPAPASRRCDTCARTHDPRVSRRGMRAGRAAERPHAVPSLQVMHAAATAGWGWSRRGLGGTYAVIVSAPVTVGTVAVPRAAVPRLHRAQHRSQQHAPQERPHAPRAAARGRSRRLSPQNHATDDDDTRPGRRRPDARDDETRDGVGAAPPARAGQLLPRTNTHTHTNMPTQVHTHVCIHSTHTVNRNLNTDTTGGGHRLSSRTQSCQYLSSLSMSIIRMSIVVGKRKTHTWIMCCDKGGKVFVNERKTRLHGIGKRALRPRTPLMPVRGHMGTGLATVFSLGCGFLDPNHYT